MIVARAPKEAAPDSPETTCGSPLIGLPSMRMPRRATESFRGDEAGHMVAQNIPGGDVRLAAVQSRHDRGHISADLARCFPSPATAPLVEACRVRALNDYDDLRRIFFVAVDEISVTAPRERPDASLYKDMCRTAAELIGGLARHGSVSLHDP
jgi:hypothetical protein